MSRATWAASWTRSWFSPNKPTPGWVSITTRPLAFHPGVIKSAFPLEHQLTTSPSSFSLSLFHFHFSFGTSTYRQPLLPSDVFNPGHLVLSMGSFHSGSSGEKYLFRSLSSILFLIILSFNVLDANGLMQGSCFKNTKEITSLPLPNLLKTTKCHSFAPLDGSGAMFW